MGAIKNGNGDDSSNLANDLTALGYGPYKVSQLLRQVLNLAEERLLEHGASLSEDVVRATMLGLRDMSDPEMQNLVSDGWQMIYRAVEEVNWSEERNQVLERLIVRHFSHLLPPRGKPPIQNETLSRRVIPAFLFMLQQMIGRERLDEYQAKCHEIVDEMKQENGDIFEWDKVYESPYAAMLVQDVLVLMAQYLRDAPKRRHWMIDVFSRNMPTPHSDAERNWHFGDQEFHLLMDALYTPMAESLSKPDRLTEMRNRYGEANIVMVQEALRALARDKMIVAENLVEKKA